MSGIIGNVTSKSGIIPPLFLKSGELNSLGFIEHNFFGIAYDLSVNGLDENGWAEMTGTWSKCNESSASGSDDADIFGKFSSGRFTPTISGWYFVAYSFYMGGGITDNRRFGGRIARNGVSGTQVFALVLNQNAGGSADNGISGSAIVPLDTNDYVSCYCYHDSTSGEATNVESGTINITYVGTSDL